jgi:hypothetical protein
VGDVFSGDGLRGNVISGEYIFGISRDFVSLDHILLYLISLTYLTVSLLRYSGKMRIGEI